MSDLHVHAVVPQVVGDPLTAVGDEVVARDESGARSCSAPGIGAFSKVVTALRDVLRRLDEAPAGEVRREELLAARRHRARVEVGIVAQQVARGERALVLVRPELVGEALLVRHQRQVGKAEERDLVVAAAEHDVLDARPRRHDRVDLVGDGVRDRVRRIRVARVRVPGVVQALDSPGALSTGTTTPLTPRSVSLAR